MMHRPTLKLLLIATALAGCGVVKEKVSRKEQATEYLNARRYDDAIKLLEDLSQESPGDSDIKVLLASAYAGSVGFNVIDAFDTFAPILFTKADHRSNYSFMLADAASSPLESAKPELKELEQEMLKFLDSFTANFRTFVNVPLTPIGERPRLVQAILLLSDVPEGDAAYVKSRTYAALINALQFLNFSRDSLGGLLSKREVTLVQVICNLEVHTFLENLDTSTGYLLSSLDDLTIAYRAHDVKEPGRLSELKDVAVHVKEVYEKNKAVLDDADLVFNTTKSTYCQ